MFKIAKKLTVIMLSASIIFSCSGIIAHAEYSGSVVKTKI